MDELLEAQLTVKLTREQKRWLREATAGTALSQGGLMREALARLRQDVESGKLRLAPGVFIEEEEGEG